MHYQMRGRRIEMPKWIVYAAQQVGVSGDRRLTTTEFQNAVRWVFQTAGVKDGRPWTVAKLTDPTSRERLRVAAITVFNGATAHGKAIGL